MKTVLLGIICFALTAASCAPVYVPSARHTNLLDKKGELHASAQTGTNGMNLQAGYAITPSLGLITAFSFDAWGEQNSGLEDAYFRHRYQEAGATWYKVFEENGRFELLAGAGYGYSTATDDAYEPSDGKYHKIFTQANLGLESGIFEGGVALRMAQVTFPNLQPENSDEKNSGTFVEPAIFGRVGWENIKFEVQYGSSGAIQRELTFGYRPRILSFGLHMSLGLLKPRE